MEDNIKPEMSNITMSIRKMSNRNKLIIVIVVGVVVLFIGALMVWIFSGDDPAPSSTGNCTPPTLSAYDLSSVTGSLSKSDFSIAGVLCAQGYTGTPSATACRVAGQAYYVEGCSAVDDTTNPCSLSNVTVPENGSLGTTCADTTGFLAHDVSCDMTCNDGSPPTNQPRCNNGTLSSNTATCGSVVVDPVARTCSDINGDGTNDPFNCHDRNFISTAICPSGPCTATECCGPAQNPEQICVQPIDTNITDVYDFNTVAETSLSLSMDKFGDWRGGYAEAHGITCNTGYSGQVVVGVCSADGQAYTLTGCSADDDVGDAGDASGSTDSSGNCTPPTLPAYDLSNVTGSLSKSDFSIVGVSCAQGFTGTPLVTACSEAGLAYNVVGCGQGCSLSTVTVPDNGRLGHACTHIARGSLDHDASCDMSCNPGYSLTNQPICNDGTLSSNTVTCAEKTCADTDCGNGATCGEGVTGDGYTCTCDAGYWGAATTNVAATCTEKTCADTDGSSTAATCGNGATCGEGGTDDGYSCTCDAGYWGAATTNVAATCTEKTCSNTDGQGAAPDCGTGATCADGGVGGGYTCSCGARYTGTPVSNGQANCTQIVDCDGHFGQCDSGCFKRYTITRRPSGGGDPCPHEDGQGINCPLVGESACTPDCRDDQNVEECCDHWLEENNVYATGC